MARIRRLTADQMDPEMAALIDADDRTPLELAVTSIIGHRPDLALPLIAYTRSLKKGQLSRRLVEIVRLRIAFHNQCRSCMAIRYQDAVVDGLTEDLVCSLEKPAEAEGLTDAEQVALRYADLFATNHLAIDDALYAELGEYFTEGEIVELGLQVALFVGVGRLAATWHIVEDLPVAFQAESADVLSPWGNESVPIG
jgi:AhpD family alkylhydroperoxidase